MIRPRNEAEDILLSIIKNCETLIKQTHTKPQETLDFKLTIPKGTFSFKPSLYLGHDSNWMVGLTSLEVYNSIFNIQGENKKFERYTYNFEVFSFAELKD